LDIIYYDDLINDDEDLILPHPRLHQRRFVLTPLCEIAPDFVHPVFKVSNKVLLERCEDCLGVKVK
jgi:2-amino-4-hydroxy-6-hydroxymethyldihydropteridine diphosphokinase